MVHHPWLFHGPLVQVPLTLHFGWTTAAALVNWTLSGDVGRNPWFPQKKTIEKLHGFSRASDFCSWFEDLQTEKAGFLVTILGGSKEKPGLQKS